MEVKGIQGRDGGCGNMKKKAERRRRALAWGKGSMAG